MSIKRWIKKIWCVCVCVRVCARVYVCVCVYTHSMEWASQVAQWVKNPPAMQEMQVQSLGWEDPLEEGMATHSSILAWKIPWREEPGRLQSIVNWSNLAHTHTGEEASRCYRSGPPLALQLNKWKSSVVKPDIFISLLHSHSTTPPLQIILSVKCLSFQSYST